MLFYRQIRYFYCLILTAIFLKNHAKNNVMDGGDKKCFEADCDDY